MKVQTTVSFDLLPRVGEEVEETIAQIEAEMEAVIADEYGVVASVKTENLTDVNLLVLDADDDRFPMMKGALA